LQVKAGSLSPGRLNKCIPIRNFAVHTSSSMAGCSARIACAAPASGLVARAAACSEPTVAAQNRTAGRLPFHNRGDDDLFYGRATLDVTAGRRTSSK
jgi:hypothetical protein